MDALAPALISRRDASSGSRGHADDFGAEQIDQRVHLFRDITASRHDERLRDSARGNEQPFGRSQRRRAGVGLPVAEQNRHEREGVDRDHLGIPSSP